MKGFIINILKFSPIGLGTTIILIFLYGLVFPDHLKSNLSYRIGWWGHIYSRLEEVKAVSDIDILFVGSSHAYRGFDNRIFEQYGLKTFNLGTSAQTPIQSKVLLSRYLEQLRPKKVIFEVSPIIFASEGLESAFDLISNDKNDIHSLKMAFTLKHIKVYNTLVFAYLSDLFQLNKKYVEDKFKFGDAYINGGYVKKEFKHFRYVKHKELYKPIKEIQLSALQDCKDLIAEVQAEVILVQAPITNAYYNSFSNNAVFDSTMQSYGRYYNFNNLDLLDDSLHFYDLHHMNQDGVNIFNEKLIDSLGISLKG